MARQLVRLAPIAALAALLGAPLAAHAQSPNVDSLVEQALTKNAGAQDGLLIARAMTDTGVQRAMEHDQKAADQIHAAVQELERARHGDGDTRDQARARERFVAAIKKATGRDISGPTQFGMIHTPRIDVHVPGVNIHMDPDSVRVPAYPTPPTPPGVPAPPPAPAGLVLTDSLKALVERARHDPGAATLPAIEDFTAGPRDVSGVTHGSVATVGGPLTVSGVVDGDVAAVAGDVIILPGALVHGNATAIGGDVRESGGIVQGEVRSTSGKIGPVAHVIAHTPRTASHEFRVSLACLALMLVIGIGVLTFAGDPLDAAAQAVSEQFGRALGYGIIGALAVVPLLVVMLIAAIVTVIGFVFTPVIVVLYSLVVLGVILVGFFAVAETTGRAVYRRRQALDPLSERGAKLRAIVTGIAIYGGLWVIAAILSGLPVVGSVLHVLASAITTIVILVGCGAVLVSRRDARTVATIRAQTGAPASPVPDLLWQTPTPVGGVAAARRPTPPPPTSGPVT